MQTTSAAGLKRLAKQLKSAKSAHNQGALLRALVDLERKDLEMVAFLCEIPSKSAKKTRKQGNLS